MFTENNFVLIGSVFVLIACVSVMLIIFIAAKTMIFMNRAKLQTAGKGRINIPKEASDNEVKPKKERRHLFEMLKEKMRRQHEESESLDGDDPDSIESDSIESEAAGADERQDAGGDSGKRKDEVNVIYEQGRGYRFDVSHGRPDPNDNITDGAEEAGADEPHGQDEPEPEDTREPDTLELCMEIERFTDKANKLGEYILTLIEAQGLAMTQELIDIVDSEDYDELPYEADELQQELERLIDKTNRQVDYIEEIGKNQANNIINADNKNTDQVFLACVANAFNNMQQNELVYKPARQRGNQDITYVSSNEFFEVVSGKLSGYKKKEIVEALKQHGIVANSDKGYDSVIKGKRMLKIYSEQFSLLTTEIEQNVGA